MPHFQDFVDHYEEKYEKDYGKYRLDRIISVVKNFLDCGDYMKVGGARRVARQGRARLLAKIYEVRAFTCPKCNSGMSIIPIIMDTEEIRKILQHLVRIGRSPPGINTVSLN